MHFENFCRTALKPSYTIVCFAEEICLNFHGSDFTGRMSKLNNRYRLEMDDFFKSTGKKMRNVIKVFCQEYCHVLIHHWEQLLHPFHDSSFLHKRMFLVGNQHKWIQLKIVICLPLIVNVLLWTLETKSQMLLMKKRPAVEDQSLHH